LGSDDNKVSLYLPIQYSYYSPDKNIELIFDIVEDTQLNTFGEYSIFMTHYNKWVKSVSKKEGLTKNTIYPLFEVQQWLKYEDKIIGFISNNLMHYIKPISENVARSYVAAPIQVILHHPLHINRMILQYKNGNAASGIKVGWNPTTYAELQKSLYNYHLYVLVLLQYISIFKKQRNTALRKQIVSVITKTKFDKNTTSLRQFIDDNIESPDKEKLKNIINRSLSHSRDKKKIIDDIESSYFEFDKIGILKLKQMEKSDIKKKLIEMSRDIIKFGKINNTKLQFPNIVSACDDNTKSKSKVKIYCDNHKLIVSKEEFMKIIDVVASDIANPLRQKWLFNEIFLDRYVNFFKFIRRPNETITIEFVN
jgi:hypothetical protein